MSIGLATGNSHDLNGVGTVPTTWPPANAAKAGVANVPDSFSFFVNSSITPTDFSKPNNVNYSSRPRSVDQFILISAGPDGIYGNADDIASFGDVSQ
jgi:hypothetical protein